MRAVRGSYFVATSAISSILPIIVNGSVNKKQNKSTIIEINFKGLDFIK